MTDVRFVNFYDMLQIAATASPDEIRTAITSQRRIWVKRQASPDPARRTEAETRVRDIDAAEKTLLDKARRAEFDRDLAEYRPPAETPMASSDGVPWIERARGYLAAENPSAANYAAREALNQRANDHEAWFVRAHSSFMMNNVRDAEYEFAEAIRLEPNSAWYHYGLGEVYASQSKWRSAMAEFQQAVKIEPGNPVYRTSIAQILLENDKAAEAVAIMEKVVAENPGNQAFGYYLAIALHDSMLESLGKARRRTVNGMVVEEGGYFIISEAQVALVKKTTKRIKDLAVGDSDIDELVDSMQKQVLDALTIKWDLSGSGGWFLSIFLFGVLPFLVGVGGAGAGPAFFGLIFGGCLIWWFTALRRKPLWKHRRASPALVSKGI